MDDLLLLAIAVLRPGGRQVVTPDVLAETRRLTLRRSDEADAVVTAIDPPGSPLTSYFGGSA